MRFIVGQDVLLVDGDEQSSPRDFTELRRQLVGNVGYTTVALRGAALRTPVRQLIPKL